MEKSLAASSEGKKKKTVPMGDETYLAHGTELAGVLQLVSAHDAIVVVDATAGAVRVGFIVPCLERFLDFRVWDEDLPGHGSPTL